MNSISLLGMDFTGVLLNVLAIIGIIVAGGFLIFFLGDLLLSVLDPSSSALKDKNKQVEQQPVQVQERVKPQELTYEVKEEKPKVVEYTSPYKEVDMQKALEEEKALFAHVEEKNVVEERQPTPEEIFNRLKEEERLYNERKIKAENEKVFPVSTPKFEEEDDDLDDFNFEDLFLSDEDDFDVEEDAKPFATPAVPEILKKEEPAHEDKFGEFESGLKFEEEPAEEEFDIEFEEEVEEEPVVEEEHIVEDEESENRVIDQSPEIDHIKEELARQNELLRQQIEELLKERQSTETQLKELSEKVATPVAVKVSGLTEEEYEERLAELRERLRFNEKELRNIKKEYIPLRKVRTTLEKDKKKLRRREALVAKQKILLYGVNNIADIDAEKAQKLEEDLDLLEGLRLSVQHCEEVIKNSEERYPVLETSYNILTKNIDQIKADIEELERQQKSAK